MAIAKASPHITPEILAVILGETALRRGYSKTKARRFIREGLKWHKKHSK